MRTTGVLPTVPRMLSYLAMTLLPYITADEAYDIQNAPISIEHCFLHCL